MRWIALFCEPNESTPYLSKSYEGDSQTVLLKVLTDLTQGLKGKTLSKITNVSLEREDFIN